MTTADEIALTELAISAIEQIITAVRNAKSGSVNADEVTANITSLHNVLTVHNSQADSTLDAKFRGTP